jgi:predicted transcriptional regulator
MASKNRVTVNLTDDEAAQFAELAERERVSKAWLGRRAICDLLDRTRTHDQGKPRSIISGRRGKR